MVVLLMAAVIGAASPVQVDVCLVPLDDAAERIRALMPIGHLGAWEMILDCTASQHYTARFTSPEASYNKAEDRLIWGEGLEWDITLNVCTPAGEPLPVPTATPRPREWLYVITATAPGRILYGGSYWDRETADSLVAEYMANPSRYGITSAKVITVPVLAAGEPGLLGQLYRIEAR